MRTTFSLTKRIARRQSGLTLGEALLVLGVMSSVLVGAYGAYKYARSDVGANNLAQGAVQLAAQTQSVFGANGGYASVTAANLNSAGLVPSGWRWDGTNILDSAEQKLRINTTTFNDRTRVQFGQPVWFVGFSYSFGAGQRRPEGFDFGSPTGPG